MKKLGILGGMGPYATLIFYRFILNATQWMVQPRHDNEHIHTLIDVDVHIPSRNGFINNHNGNPAEDIAYAIDGLISAGCEKIAVPCNSAQYFREDAYEIASQKGLTFSWIDMIDIVGKEVRARKLSRPLILGADIVRKKHSELYGKYFDVAECNDSLHEQTKTVIYERKKEKFINKIGLNEDLERQYDCVLLACTELTQGDVVTKLPVLCSTKIYANEVVKLCME